MCSWVVWRPGQGRIAADPGETAFERMSVEGPMARNVADAAMLLDVMAGYDSRDPMSLDDPAESFEEAAAQQRVPPRTAFSPCRLYTSDAADDLHCVYPGSPRVIQNTNS